MSFYLIPLALIITGVLVALAIWSQGGIEDGTGQETKIVEVKPGSLPVLGREDAPVSFVEFGDYQCSFCAKFLTETESRFRKDYVTTGKMKMYWRDFAFLGPESNQAALAARCANEQNSFWQYHDILFLNQQGENQGGPSNEKLISLAAELGLDETTFRQCLETEKYLSDVEADIEAGRALGVQGTPTVFINGERIVGASPTKCLR